MLINLIHRPEPDPYRRDIFKMQQEMVHAQGMRSTIMATLPSLEDDECIALMKHYHSDYGDELGISLHSLDTESLVDLVGYKEVAFWLYSEKDKRKVFQFLLDKFVAAFGFPPMSIASYHLDASSMEIILELCPSIIATVAGCFEEGVRVYHGCNHSWYLFNEGMPWAAWYPSKTHSLRPAQDENDAFGVVAVPHLTRDMTLAYEGRNDFWASHPPNVQRGMGNKGENCPYDKNLIDQHRFQERFNDGFSYLNVFVGAAWLIHNHNSEEPPSVSVSLYKQQLEYLRSLIDAGEAESMTMSEFARWYKSNVPINHREVCLAKEILYGSGKHYFWFLDPHMRVLFDLNQGCSIGDLRPYMSQVQGRTGIDNPEKYMGSYPYLIQSQQRTGYLNHFSDGSRTTAILKYGNIEVDLADVSFRCDKVFENQKGFVTTPTKIEFGKEGVAQMIIEVRIEDSGQIIMERKLLSLEGDHGTELQITEYVKACYGKTDYPEDLSSVTLQIETENAETKMLQYGYRRRSIEHANVNNLRAVIPPVNTHLELAPADQVPWSGTISEGILFNPYFTLTLTRNLQSDNSSQVCLSLKTMK